MSSPSLRSSVGKGSVGKDIVGQDIVNQDEQKAIPGGPHSPEPTLAQVNAAVVSFAMLADPTRVRILWALHAGDSDVASLAAAAGCRPTVASQHLSKLRLAGLVEGTRDGRRVLYRVRGGHVRNLLREAMFHADHQISGEPVHD